MYLPDVRVFHFESKTNGDDDTPEVIRRAMEEIAYVGKRWPVFSARDPYDNPNPTVDAEDLSLRI